MLPPCKSVLNDGIFFLFMILLLTNFFRIETEYVAPIVQGVWLSMNDVSTVTIKILHLLPINYRSKLKNLFIYRLGCSKYSYDYRLNIFKFMAGKCNDWYLKFWEKSCKTKVKIIGIIKALFSSKLSCRLQNCWIFSGDLARK